MNRDDKAMTVLDQFSLRRLYPRGRLFNEVRQRPTCAEQHDTFQVSLKIDWADAPPGCCMFATGLITADAVGRVCELTGCFCPPDVFKDPKVFQMCSSRAGEQEKERR